MDSTNPTQTSTSTTTTIPSTDVIVDINVQKSLEKKQQEQEHNNQQIISDPLGTISPQLNSSYTDSPDISLSNANGTASSSVRSLSSDNILLDSSSPTRATSCGSLTSSTSNEPIQQQKQQPPRTQPVIVSHGTSNNNNFDEGSTIFYISKNPAPRPSVSPIELSPTSTSTISTPSPKTKVKKIRKPRRKSMRPKFNIHAPLVISIIQMTIGLALVFPLVVGVLIRHIALLMYGGYGILLALSSVVAIYGTVTIGLMAKYQYIDLVKNWQSSIAIIACIGVVALVWAIACLVWINPLITDMLNARSNKLSDTTETEEKDIQSIVNDTHDLEKLTQTARPQYGVALPENPIIIAIRKFNKDPDKALNYLKAQNIVPSGNLINFLHQEDGLDKKKIGELLGGKLPGEAQQIDKIMECFASKYTRDNPNSFGDPNTAYILAFSIILLNTDAHNPNIVNKMDKKAFIRNCDFRKDKKFESGYLSSIYDRIVNNEIKMDKETLSNNAIYKGWLFKLSSKSKRQHKRWFVVKNNCLYYFKNSQDVDEDSPSGIIPLESLSVKRLSNDSFMIEDPELNHIKSVKITKNGPVQGHSTVLILKCTKAKYNDLDKWIDTIRSNMLGDPVLMLIKKKKVLLEKTHAFEEENGYNPLDLNLGVPSQTNNNNNNPLQSDDDDDHHLNNAVLN
ncbi:hypothetical protein DFA_11559 [Cavenderia fasciculata]|uniref:Pleckstrin domain-containing protein n=1 Tax=Cavenderia fasciculata TaxID=261658 RepID=F4QDK1_CACFS|nr:uncharacterized protein DFA_11559 [Cavenderia fasciculata]EGG13798.1 hypothetical protein DFA_11559 [Cavenderia fasciculata]|eukprot:XP_004350506.1 hypothetical protein DFA_11559 [Cavenderia fasciculata]